ncbi:type II CAAX prenyl endopeptidase Rce1 family protein [Planomonospora sp. ID82291]|uniref:CPBP family glutamic-type intramembrane protease n=1 Tax=Planomonospora sp. ID82291 TaxID=2738136 RepID=UPI0018C3BC0A|nr:CPBP family glutamic-type intramembrane protease [Planomonospora sp. ID82291]MBG0817884.1 CPBP family intramembrane metalloprotease [Planomonospora sp. ID82291]
MLIAFCVLAYVLAWVFWIPAALLFEADAGRIPAGLVTLQTLGAAAPTVAALLVLRVRGRTDLIRAIARRYRIWRLPVRWYLAAALLMPALTSVALAVRAVADPTLTVPADSPLGTMLAGGGPVVVVLTAPLQLAGLLFSSPLLEEFGWRGYALPALQQRMAALPAAVLLGLLWGLWHLPLTVAYGEDLPPYLVAITAHSVLAAWLLNSTRGSMVITLLFHASLAYSLTSMSVGGGDWLEAGLAWTVALAVVAGSGWRELSLRPRTTLLPDPAS